MQPAVSGDDRLFGIIRPPVGNGSLNKINTGIIIKGEGKNIT